MFSPLVSLTMKSLQAYEYTPPISAVEALVQRLPCLWFVSWLLSKRVEKINQIFLFSIYSYSSL